MAQSFISELGDRLGGDGVANTEGEHVKTISAEYYKRNDSGTVSNQSLQSAIDGKADDSAVVHLAGNETITGTKTFNKYPSINESDMYKRYFSGQCPYGTLYANWDSELKDNNHFRKWTLNFGQVSNGGYYVITINLIGTYNYGDSNGTLTKKISFQFWRGDSISVNELYDSVSNNKVGEYRIGNFHSDNGYFYAEIISNNPRSNNIAYINGDIIGSWIPNVNLQISLSIVKGWPAWAGDINTTPRLQSNGTNVLLEGDTVTNVAIGSASGKPLITTTGGAVTTGTFGTSAGQFAEGNHKHSGSDITSGTVGVSYGGTGKSSVTTNNFLVGNGTSALVEKTPTEVRTLIGAGTSSLTIGTTSTTAAAGNHKHSGSDITSGTVGVSHGGTGKTSVTANNFLVGNGTSALVEKTPAQVLSLIGAVSSSSLANVAFSGKYSSLTGKPSLTNDSITLSANTTIYVTIMYYFNLGRMVGSLLTNVHMKGGNAVWNNDSIEVLHSIGSDFSGTPNITNHILSCNLKSDIEFSYYLSSSGPLILKLKNNTSNRYSVSVSATVLGSSDITDYYQITKIEADTTAIAQSGTATNVWCNHALVSEKIGKTNSATTGIDYTSKGNTSTPIYLDNGEFKECTSISTPYEWVNTFPTTYTAGKVYLL